MPAPSYTYTLTNGSTADASQVMQDFNDVLNGVTDGTKDLSFSALTANGASNLKAAVILGTSSANDLTVNGSLASSVPIKTDASFDIGSSTLGLRSIYFGANSQRVRIIPSASMSATWTLTLPVSAGSSNQYLKGDGSGNLSWVSPATDIPACVPGTSAGVVPSSGLPGNITGSVATAGYLAEMFGSAQAGTNGNAYSFISTSALTSSTATLIDSGSVFSKGLYVVIAKIQTQQTDGTNRAAFFRITLNGTAVNATDGIMPLTTGVTNQGVIFAVVQISANSSVIRVTGSIVSLSGSSSANNHEMMIWRAG